MYCSNCGYNNAPGALLCAQCAVALTAGPAPTDPTQPGGAPAPPPPPGEPYPPGGYPPPGAPAPGPYGPESGGYPPPGPPGAPPGYPPGPPGYPPGFGYGGPGGPGGKKKSQKGLLVGLLALLVVFALIAAAFLVFGGKDDDTTEVVLEPIGSVQQDDFAGNLDLEDLGEDVGVALVDTPARQTQVDATLAGTVAPGSEPGLYGGSQDAAVCNIDQLLTFLQDEANSAKAEAWASVLGVEGGVGGIADYVGRLTAVRLRFDTRVTNHGFRDGEANPFQSVLQAGTAVLVDDHGVPRVKCNCGNPLAEPGALGDLSAEDASDIDSLAQNPDDAWESFDVQNVVVVQQGDVVTETFVLLTLDDGRVFRRPIGSNGNDDSDFDDRAGMCDPGGKLAGSPTCEEPELGSGDVQITLRWNSDADLDLHVLEPDGTEIYYGAPGPTTTGGQLDVDGNRACTPSVAVENVFWPEGSAPTGTYSVQVDGYDLSCGGGDYTLTIKVAGQDDVVHPGSVAQDETDTYSFEA